MPRATCSSAIYLFIYLFFFSVPNYSEENHKKYNVSRKLYQQM